MNESERALVLHQSELSLDKRGEPRGKNGVWVCERAFVNTYNQTLHRITDPIIIPTAMIGVAGLFLSMYLNSPVFANSTVFIVSAMAMFTSMCVTWWGLHYTMLSPDCSASKIIVKITMRQLGIEAQYTNNELEAYDLSWWAINRLTAHYKSESFAAQHPTLMSVQCPALPLATNLPQQQ